MKIRSLPILASFLVMVGIAATATAAVTPFVRVDYGGSQFRMTDVNLIIDQTEAGLKEAGLPADFDPIGPAYGPGICAGVWLRPELRIGATFSYLRALQSNVVSVPDELRYDDYLDFRMYELGAEAAWRFDKLMGLTVGADVAQARGEVIEELTIETPGGPYYQTARAHKSKPTFGGFVGLDQTNDAGVAGFIRVGYQYRDMGRMPSELTTSDGVNTAQGTGETPWLDYSGFYVRVGVGYDFRR